MLRANHAHFEGRLEKCERLAHHAFTLRFEGHDETAVHLFELQMLFVRREQGRLEEIVQSLEASADQYPQVGMFHSLRAYLPAQLGRTAQARRALAVAAHVDFEDIPRDTYWLANLAALSEVVFFLGDRPRAQRLYELLAAYADRCVIIVGFLCHGSASRHLGLLATTLSRYDDAERHFEHAITMNAQIRSPLWTAHTQHDYARMLLQRNRPGDQDKAFELLRNALDTAEQLGLKALAHKASPLMQAAVATEPSPPLIRPMSRVPRCLRTRPGMC